MMTRMRPIIHGAILLTLLMGLVSTARADLSGPERREAFDQAQATFGHAVALLASDRARAIGFLDQAIAGYRRILDDGHIASGPLYYNIANAYMLRGDVGRAILAYRRAQELMPSDENLAANLAYARQRVRNRIDASDRTRAEHLLLFWHYDLSPRARFAIFSSAFGIAWLLALVHLVSAKRRTWLWWPTGACALVSALMLGSLIVRQYVDQRRNDGVIVAGSLVGRKGPDGSAYQPSFTEPLTAGVEFRVLDERIGWLLVELRDERQTWLPASGVELIDPA